MALTPEEVVNQRFTITKFRDGYDLDQVDDFLDSIVEELRRRDQELADLQAELDRANERVEELTAELDGSDQDDSQGNVSEQTIVVDAKPVPAAPAAEAAETEQPGGDATAVKSSAMLQLALELHDKYVKDGETERDRLVRQAEQSAKQLVEEAQVQRAEELRKLEDERKDYSGRIKELREFESEYRNTLSSYIQAQLRDLEGSPEPQGAPKSLD